MNRKTILVFSASLIVVTVLSSTLFYGLGLNIGAKGGYLNALKDVSEQVGLDYTWKELADGSYEVKIWSQSALQLSRTIRVDSLVTLIRGGQVIESERNAGVLTNGGKDWIEGQLSGTINGTAQALYISVDDTDASGLSAASTQLTSELAASGLTRALGSYTSTGVGAWTVAKAFSVTGTVSAQTYGAQWSLASASNNNLLCYDTSAVKNCVNGDTLTVTWTLSVS